MDPHLPAGELAHDRYHVERVYRWALRLAPEAGASEDLVGAAAIVHDLAAIPKDSPDRALGGTLSAKAAGPHPDEAGYSVPEANVILDAVRTSSWSRGYAPNSPEGAALQDADRLDAIGAIGAARCLACAQYMSKPERPGRFYHPDDPAAQTDRPLDDVQQAADHFYAKLLKLSATMHTEMARTEAARRHDSLLRFLKDLALDVA